MSSKGSLGVTDVRGRDEGTAATVVWPCDDAVEDLVMDIQGLRVECSRDTGRQNWTGSR